MAKDTLYTTREDVSVDFEGAPVMLHAGKDLVREGHKLLKQYPGLFEPSVRHVRFEVEQATSAPGEKRGA